MIRKMYFYGFCLLIGIIHKEHLYYQKSTTESIHFFICVFS